MVWMNEGRGVCAWTLSTNLGVPCTIWRTYSRCFCLNYWHIRTRLTLSTERLQRCRCESQNGIVRKWLTTSEGMRSPKTFRHLQCKAKKVGKTMMTRTSLWANQKMMKMGTGPMLAMVMVMVTVTVTVTVTTIWPTRWGCTKTAIKVSMERRLGLMGQDQAVVLTLAAIRILEAVITEVELAVRGAGDDLWKKVEW